MLSSPHQTPHPFFQQPNPAARFHAEIEGLIAAAGLESTFIRPGIFASNTQFWWGSAIRDGDVVRWPYGAAETAPIDERDVAAAWGAAIGHPAFVTSTVADVVGSPPRTFRQWVSDHSDAFRRPPTSYESDTP